MQWIRCSIVMVLYLLFLLWVKSWLGLIVVPFIFDAYITKKIPWTWWKKLTNPTARTVMSWVDAIILKNNRKIYGVCVLLVRQEFGTRL